jgi:Acyl carrier protein phosphodiesterase
MKILHLTCSPRGQISESYRLSRKIIGCLLKSEPTAVVTHRPLGGGAISHIDESYATALGAAQESGATAQAGSMSRVRGADPELESADVLVIGTPMHNFTVPSALKAWIDHIVRVRRTFNVTPQGKVGTLSDRPVFVAVSSGGRFSGERARQPDFLTPYLKAILATIGLQDLTFFTIEGSGPSVRMPSPKPGPGRIRRCISIFRRSAHDPSAAFCPRLPCPLAADIRIPQRVRVEAPPDEP